MQLFRFGLKGDGKLKDAATARHTVHADEPAHEFNKLLTDRKPQSRPSVDFRGRSIRLHEGLKDPCTGILRDPDPRVGDGEAQMDDIIGSSRDVD